MNSGLQSQCRECQLAWLRAKSGSLSRAEHAANRTAFETEPTRECWHCYQTKPIEEFYEYSQMPGRRHRVCRSCEADKMRTPELLAKAAAYARAPNRRKERAAAMKRWRVRHPLIVKAYRAVNTALRRGVLKREVCYKCQNPKTEAHHHLGYDHLHWLDVKWLCKNCHSAEHRTR